MENYGSGDSDPRDPRGMGRGIPARARQYRAEDERRRRAEEAARRGALKPDQVIAGLWEWHSWSAIRPRDQPAGTLISMRFDMVGVNGDHRIPSRVEYVDKHGGFRVAATYDGIADAVAMFRFIKNA